MKTIRQRLSKLFNHKRNGKDNNDQQINSAEYNDDSGESVAIKNKSWLHRTQDSIWEIFLMCMGPYM